jgi:hypothetical protein
MIGLRPIKEAHTKFRQLKQWFGKGNGGNISSIFLELAIFENGEPAIALSGPWSMSDEPELPPDALDGWDLFVDNEYTTVRKNEYLERIRSVKKSALIR